MGNRGLEYPQIFTTLKMTTPNCVMLFWNTNSSEYNCILLRSHLTKRSSVEYLNYIFGWTFNQCFKCIALIVVNVFLPQYHLPFFLLHSAGLIYLRLLHQILILALRNLRFHRVLWNQGQMRTNFRLVAGPKRWQHLVILRQQLVVQGATK